MATSGTLIDDVVRISGLSKPTIRSYVEKLRENGLIRKTGRGSSAATMKFDDAAALLATTLADPIISEAAGAARAALMLPLFRAYVYDPCELASVTLRVEEISKESDAWHVRTFGDVLRHLLLRAVSFRPEKGFDRRGWERLFDAGGKKQKIEVHFYRNAERRPTYFAFVKLKFTSTEHLCLEYGSVKAKEPRESEEPSSTWFTLYEDSGYQHLSTRSIGMPTLLAFARSVEKEITHP